MESMVLGAAFSSLALVWQAYSRVKSNKERCGQLKNRCELIHDRLHAIVLRTDVDARVLRRVKDLESTFKLTAETITKVGTQNYLLSVLRSEENAALIEDTQRALAELVTLMTLESIIDVSAWQKEAERARASDYRALLVRCAALEQGQAAASAELVEAGATLEELRRGVQVLAAMVGAQQGAASASARVRSLRESGPAPAQVRRYGQQVVSDGRGGGASELRPRSWSLPIGVRPSREAIMGSGSGGGVATPTSSRSAPPSTSRRSALGRLHIPALAQRNLAEPSSAVEYLYAPSFSPSVASASAAGSSSSLLISSLTPEAAAAFGAPATGEPITPPPSYQAVEAELLAARMRTNPETHSLRSRASTEAVRSLATSFDETLHVRGRRALSPSPSRSPVHRAPKPSDSALARVKDALKRKDVEGFRLLKSTGTFGVTNRRIVLELYALPARTSGHGNGAAAALPLDLFAPAARDVLAFKTRSEPRPVENFNEVIVLCPREGRPVCVVTRSNRERTQPSLKTYVLDTLQPQTLVSVKDGVGTTSWYFIPYYPAMYVEEVKKLIQDHYARNRFSQVIVTNCNLVHQKTELHDKSTLCEAGVKPYEHHIKLRISS